MKYKRKSFEYINSLFNEDFFRKKKNYSSLTLCKYFASIVWRIFIVGNCGRKFNFYFVVLELKSWFSNEQFILSERILEKQIFGLKSKFVVQILEY